MNLQDIIKDVRDRLSERESFNMGDNDYGDGSHIGNFWKNDFIERRVQEAHRQFNREERWPWLLRLRDNIVVGANQSNVALEDDVDLSRHNQLLLFRNTSPNTILLPEKVSPFTGLKLRQRYYVAGDPAYFVPHRSEEVSSGTGEGISYVVRTIIRLIPTPNAAWTGEYAYYRNAPKLTRLDEPLMPEAYHDAIVAWAEAQCWLKEQTSMGQSKAQDAFNMYNSVLDKARKEFKAQASGEKLSWGGEPPRTEVEDWRHRNLPQNVGV